MPTFYETLGVSPAAGAGEIESAIDRIYNETRRRVTSFDPQVAAQANQDLIVLEKIRATLLDSGARAAYDQSLGIPSGLSGLIDPNAPPAPAGPAQPASLGMPSSGMVFGQAGAPGLPGQPYPPRPVVVSPPPVKQTWTCTQCGQENPAKTMFCKSCGGVVGLTCPKCNQTWEAANTEFCPSCGGHLQTEVQRKKLQDQLSKATQDLAAAEASNPRRDTELGIVRAASLQVFAWAGLVFIFRLLQVKALDISQYFQNYISPEEMFLGIGGYWGGLAAATIVIAVVLRARWKASWGALFAGLLLAGSTILIGYMIYDGAYAFEMDLVLGFFFLLIDLVLASQPRKFTKSVGGLDGKGFHKTAQILSRLAGWLFVLLAIGTYGGSYYVFSLGGAIPGDIFSLVGTLRTGLYWLLCAFLALQFFLGVRGIAAVQSQVRQALRERSELITQLTGQVEALKQDLSRIAR